MSDRRKRRLSAREIALLKFLYRRSGLEGRVTALGAWQRKVAVGLWRHGIVEVWYRQSPGSDRALQGPYFALGVGGARLADLFSVPRHTSP